MRAISVSRPGHPRGVEPLAQREHLGRRRRRADLAADRVADAAEELDVRAVELARALADPEHVRRAVVPLAGQRVGAGERLLVAEDQRLVARVEVDLVELGAALRGRCRRPRMNRSARSISAAIALVALALGAGRHELLVPRVRRGRGRRTRPW